jgi:AraC-like DNA-binding protein
MNTDTLSSVLRSVRLTGAVFFDVRARSPWVAEAPPARQLAQRILPGAEHIMEYHLLVEGSCWAGLIGEPALRLDAGDIVVFPFGDPHVVASDPGLRGEPEDKARALAGQDRLPVILNMGGQGTTARVICGFLACDAVPFNPLLAHLPRAFRARLESDGLVQHLIELALRESEQKRPGGECALARISELLFVEAIRAYVDSLPGEQTGWLAGLKDPCVGRALAKLHQRPAHAWSLEHLAREVGTSRSVLAERFVHLLGVPPMNYLARWRMQLAASQLSSSNASLAEIAECVGYGSEAALSRAFKRLVGVAPALWRQGRRAASEDLTSRPVHQ